MVGVGPVVLDAVVEVVGMDASVGAVEEGVGIDADASVGAVIEGVGRDVCVGSSSSSESKAVISAIHLF